MSVRVAMAILLACLCSGVALAGPNPEAVAEFERANAAFREATTSMGSDEALARDRLDVAIEGYTRLIEGMGIESPELHYNLANALLLRERLGEAILHYRRAARLAPGDANVRANLEYARTLVETRVERSDSSRLLRVLGSWNDRIPIAVRLGALAVLSGIGWLLLSGKVLGVLRRPWAMHAGLAVLGAAVFPGASLTATALLDDETAAVVVAPEAVGRKGPDVSYAESFTAPLSEGVEVSIDEERAGWVYVRLGDGRTTWVPASAVEAVAGD